MPALFILTELSTSKRSNCRKIIDCIAAHITLKIYGSHPTYTLETFIFSFSYILIIVVLGVHCDIYKSSYNMS
jgi:hypothetical protein